MRGMHVNNTLCNLRKRSPAARDLAVLTIQIAWRLKCRVTKRGWPSVDGHVPRTLVGRAEKRKSFFVVAARATTTLGFAVRSKAGFTCLRSSFGCG